MVSAPEIILHGWAVGTTGQVAVFCPWCADLHMHGEPGAVVGDILHRGAHCTSVHSPSFDGSYSVRVVGVVNHVREIEPAPLALEPGKVPMAERLSTGATFDGWGLKLPLLRALFKNGRLSSERGGEFVFTPRGLEVSASPAGGWTVRRRRKSGWEMLGRGECILALIELLFGWPRGWAAVHILRAAGAVLSAETAARVAALIDGSAPPVPPTALPSSLSPPLVPELPAPPTAGQVMVDAVVLGGLVTTARALQALVRDLASTETIEVTGVNLAEVEDSASVIAAHGEAVLAALQPPN